MFIHLSRGEVYTFIKRGGLYIFQEGGILLTGLTTPHFCACPKTRPGFPTSYGMVFFVFCEFS
jgi:hypothetical protein